MSQQTTLPDYVSTSTEYRFEEVANALRNRELPLEALRYDVTPTGLHYLLLHHGIPAVDPRSWRLSISGAVARPLRLDLDELRTYPRHSVTVTLECAGNGRGLLHPRPVGQPWLLGGVSTAVWTGTPLWPILAAAEPAADATEAVFAGADLAYDGEEEVPFERSLGLDECRSSEALLAWEMNGAELPPQHGAPLRLIVPGWYGMASVKWLTEITVRREPFEGYYQREAYRVFNVGVEDAPPIQRMLPRALLVPPGLPDVENGGRMVRAGSVTLHGRAWSGRAPVTDVEIGLGDGSWQLATIDPPAGLHAWRSFSFDWHARAGEWELTVRATDAEGNAQPLQPPWNLHGYANNAVQRLRVLVV